MTYRPLVEASGFMQVAHVMRHAEGDPWNEIETVLYERSPLDQAFPVRSQGYFAE
jgi:hypothetical protein